MLCHAIIRHDEGELLLLFSKWLHGNFFVVDWIKSDRVGLNILKMWWVMTPITQLWKKCIQIILFMTIFCSLIIPHFCNHNVCSVWPQHTHRNDNMNTGINHLNKIVTHFFIPRCCAEELVIMWPSTWPDDSTVSCVRLVGTSNSCK